MRSMKITSAQYNALFGYTDFNPDLPPTDEWVHHFAENPTTDKVEIPNTFEIFEDGIFDYFIDGDRISGNYRWDGMTFNELVRLLSFNIAKYSGEKK